METTALDNREIFEVAAEHFADRGIEPETLARIWDELERRAMTAAEISDRTELSTRDITEILDWAADQDLISTGTDREGTRVYARYNHQLEQVREEAEDLQTRLHRIWKYMVWAFGGTFLLFMISQAIVGLKGPGSFLPKILSLVFLLLGIFLVLSYLGHSLFFALQKVIDWSRSESDD